jgi:hypothetical protein
MFGDIEDKLDVLRVECTKCGRKGRYSVRRLIEKYGRKANMMKWKEQLNGDCPKRDAHSVGTLRFGVSGSAESLMKCPRHHHGGALIILTQGRSQLCSSPHPPTADRDLCLARWPC